MSYSTLFSVLLLCLVIGSCAWLCWRYWQERQYRRRPYVAPAVLDWLLHTPDPDTPPLHRVAVLGDPGAVATDGTDPILQLLSHWQHETGPDGTIIILGDNIYPTGLPAPEHPARAAAEQRFNALLAALGQYPGTIVLLSGNHDWNKGRPDGWEYLQRQEAYVREHLPRAHYLPMGGQPGPVSLQLAEGVLLIVLNTQWWVQTGARPPADAKEPFRQLQQLLEQNRHQRIVVAGHHPVYSNALHGGKFTAKQHVFPLTTVNKRAYVPLPLIGSLLPLYRKLVGAAEDMAHPRYRKMRRRLLRVLHQYPGIIYASGHDHNLQYFQKHGGHYLVSGSGSKTAFVQKGGSATFVHEHQGFFSLDFYAHGETWLRTLEPAANSSLQPAPEVFRLRLQPIHEVAPALVPVSAFK
ncbi:metallophosphoesterase [Hymenobacter taeanensis]|uniref:Metallophosphoesterase n=1 Tax=Hymenobacter taeanensis TaxID=2735321 RepID=A0A6M6BL42_9BACT|nr:MULTISPECIES: metallophosphoesterase [Hymenobacter]QJX48568.1 metallophosphoesterase [Hymenobacter taeanensis]UOQ81936.1 metallophosphoesterase [Hymenobacter sp. 5414T-23]